MTLFAKPKPILKSYYEEEQVTLIYMAKLYYTLHYWLYSAFQIFWGGPNQPGAAAHVQEQGKSGSSLFFPRLQVETSPPKIKSASGKKMSKYSIYLDSIFDFSWLSLKENSFGEM